MDSKLFVLILGAFLAVTGGFVSLFEKLSKKAIYPEEANELKKEKRFALLTFFVGAIIATVLQFSTSYSSWRESQEADRKNELTQQKNDSLTHQLIQTQQALLSISSRQMDTTLTVLKLTHNLDDAQKGLIQSQKQLNGLQTEALNQITGGKGNPILRVYTDNSFYRTSRNQKSSDNTFVFDVLNSTVYPFQTVKATISRHFSKATEFEYIDTVDSNGIPRSQVVLSDNPYDYSEKEFDLGTITGLTKTRFLDDHVILNEKSYSLIYDCMLKWSSGQVFLSFELVYQNTLPVLRNVRVISNGKNVNAINQYLQFDLSRIR